jgi:SagB-type dehydrogenase family enzyme
MKASLPTFLSLGAARLAACGNPGTAPAAAPVSPAVAGSAAAEVIALPTPPLQGILTLEETLALRRSVREFSTQPLALEELGQLLWAAQGITDPAGLRTAPSAGVLYPLEVYVVTADGVCLYEPDGHHLVVHLSGNVQAALQAAAIDQDSVGGAPAVIIVTEVYARTAQKCGEERSARYVQLEAGHVAQNVLLQAVALDLGAVPIGAFVDADMQQALALPADRQPLYLIPVGHPR